MQFLEKQFQELHSFTRHTHCVCKRECVKEFPLIALEAKFHISCAFRHYFRNQRVEKHVKWKNGVL
jgi:hypothetical protein